MGSRNTRGPVSHTGWLALLGTTLFAACAAPVAENHGPDEAGIVIDAIVIRNELAFPVTDVLIEVPATGGFAGCGFILPRSECTTFEAVDYRASPMRVSWKEYGEPHQTDDFVLRPPLESNPNEPFRVEVRIYAMGQAGATLRQ
jgi:hypothetical protein